MISLFGHLSQNGFDLSVARHAPLAGTCGFLDVGEGTAARKVSGSTDFGLSN